VDTPEMQDYGDAADRTNTGAAWLDAAKPGWEPLVSRPIDLLSDTDCLLGQAFGSFDVALQRFDHDGDWAARHGFLSDDDDVSTRHLTLAWEALIYQRRHIGLSEAVTAPTHCTWTCQPPGRATRIRPLTHHRPRRPSKAWPSTENRTPLRSGVPDIRCTSPHYTATEPEHPVP
jgi:hypothetical protein